MKPVVLAAVLITGAAPAGDRPPVVDPMIVKGVEDAPTSGQVSAKDPDGAPLTYSIVEPPKNGAATIDAATGAFTYTPARDFSGVDGFRVQATDGKAQGAATIAVRIEPVNDAPLVKPAVLSGAEDRPATTVASAVDVDKDPLQWSIARQPAHGAASIDAKSGAIVYTPTADWSGEDAFAIEAGDGRLASVAEVSVRVQPVNDAPTAAPGAATTPEDTAVEGTVAASDKDGDGLAFSIAKQPAHGKLALTDAARGAWSYQPAKDWSGKDVFTLAVTDGKAKAEAVVTIDVTPVDDPPTALPTQLTGREDEAATGVVVGRDVEGATLTYAIATPPAHGTARVGEKTGAVVFQPAPDWSGEDRFAVIVKDATSSAAVDVTVKVAPVNDAPSLAPLSLATGEDRSVDGALAAQDKEGDATTFALGQASAHGKASVRGGVVTYAPAKDFSGKDAFTIIATDGVARVEARVDVVVAAVNDAPTAPAVAMAGREDEAATGAIVATDVEQDALTYSILAKPAHGVAEVGERTGAVVYRPAADWSGEDLFTAVVKDGELATPVEVVVRVAAVNDPPRAAAGKASTNEDERATGALSASDPEGDALTYAVSAQPLQGKVVVTKDGAYTYEPAKDWSGADAFTFTATDGKAQSNAKIDVVVAPVNDAPTTAGVAVDGREDEPLRGQVRGEDVDRDALTFKVARAPAHGEAKVDAKTGAFTFVPAADYAGDDAFAVEVADRAATALAEVKVRLAPVNDAPTMTPTLVEGAEDQQAEAMVAADDVDGDAVRYALATRPVHGTATLDAATGALRYVPVKDYTGEDAFSVDASDGKSSVKGDVKVKVRPVNDAPVAQGASVATQEDVPAMGKVSGADVDRDVLTYSVGRAATKGTASVDAKTGAFTYAPNKDENGADSFTVRVSDGTAQVDAEVAVKVAPISDPPRASTSSVATAEDRAVEGALPASDPDRDPLVFSIVSAPRMGKVVLTDAAQGRFRYEPAPDAFGDDEIAFEAKEASGLKAAGVVKVKITPENDAPEVESAKVEGPEDKPLVIDVKARDRDGDKTKVRVAQQPEKGEVTVEDGGRGRLLFTPTSNQNGVVRFTVVADDGAATSQPATIEVKITGENDAPVADGATLASIEDTPVRGRLTAVDVDGDRLTFSIARPAKRGQVVVEDPATGQFTYTPSSNAFGPDSFAFAVVDATGAKGGAEVRVVVEGIDDVPVAINASLRAPRHGRVTEKLQGFDPEGNAVTFRIVQQPDLGKIEILDANSGEYAFIGDGRGGGRTIFRFVVDDGKLSSRPADVVVDVK